MENKLVFHPEGHRCVSCHQKMACCDVHHTDIGTTWCYDCIDERGYIVKESKNKKGK